MDIFWKGELLCLMLTFIIKIGTHNNINIRISMIGLSMGGLVSLYIYFHCPGLHANIDWLITINSALLGASFDTNNRSNILDGDLKMNRPKVFKDLDGFKLKAFNTIFDLGYDSFDIFYIKSTNDPKDVNSKNRYYSFLT